MSRDDDDLDFLKLQEAINQMEEDMKAWCQSSGENVGRMIETPGSDEWYIECPTCGTKWSGGSTVLSDHARPEYR
jgi:hypothetical protein